MYMRGRHVGQPHPVRVVASLFHWLLPKDHGKFAKMYVEFGCVDILEIFYYVFRDRFLKHENGNFSSIGLLGRGTDKRLCVRKVC